MLIRELFIDKALAEKYNSEGYVILPLLSDTEVAYLKQLFADSASQAGVDKQFFTSIWSDNIDYRRLIDTKIKELLTPLLLKYISDIQPVFGNYMVKNTGENTSLIPHQDWSFVEEPQYDSATVWCPLVDVDARNGNLQVIPRSHRIDNYMRARFMDRPFDTIDKEEMASMLVGVPMKAGEVMILNSRLIHASPCNYSDEARVAAALVVAPSQAPLYHWVYNGENKGKEVRKYAVTPDFYWEYSCYEYPEPMVPIETTAFILEHILLQDFQKTLGYEKQADKKESFFESIRRIFSH